MICFSKFAAMHVFSLCPAIQIVTKHPNLITELLYLDRSLNITVAFHDLDTNICYLPSVTVNV